MLTSTLAAVLPAHFIINPLTNQQVNILPLLELVGETFGGPLGTVRKIQAVHDHLTVNVVSPADLGSVMVPHHQAEINLTLVLLWNAFQQM